MTKNDNPVQFLIYSCAFSVAQQPLTNEARATVMNKTRIRASKKESKEIFVI
jgi:hypothetical protein